MLQLWEVIIRKAGLNCFLEMDFSIQKDFSGAGRKKKPVWSQ